MDDNSLLSQLAAAQETIQYQRHMIRRTDVAFNILLFASVAMGVALIVCVFGFNK